MNADKKPVWCPKCGRRIPTRNAVHACRPAVPLAEHFRGKSPRVRELYRALKAAVDKIGRVGVDSTKTRIAFHLQTIFLELQPGKDSLRGMLVLPQPARHPLFREVASLSPRIHYHWFTLTAPKQIDAAFRRLLAEGFKIGRREHLKMQPATPPGRGLGAEG